VLIYFTSGFASGRKHDRVPWKQIKDHTNDFIEPKYLPEPMEGVPQLEDPGDMKKEQIARLLVHWKRFVHPSDLFRFSRVLVHNKTDITMAALYKDSFAAVLSDPQNETVAADDWDVGNDDSDLQLFNSTTPLPLPFGVPTQNTTTQLPTPINDSPSDTFPSVPTLNPTHPTHDPNIDPALQYPFPLSGASNALTGVPTLQINPLQATYIFPSGVTTPVIGPSVSVNPVGSTAASQHPSQSRPRPKKKSKNPIASSQDPSSNPTSRQEEHPSQSRPRPKKKTKSPIASSQDPNSNPTSRQEEELGRPKRVLKRKVDLYAEAEKIAELAKQKRKK